MKRIVLLIFAIGITAMSSVSMAAMSNSRMRKETRFLTDKMAYELNLNTTQYNDIYEINYDFIYSVRYVMDDVVSGHEWALNDYYEALDIRNDDLRWVLSDSQYRRFLGLDYFYRPLYVTGGRWNFRINVIYVNHNHFYFPRPYHYRTYCGGHYRTHNHNMSYYRGRYNHPNYGGRYSIRDERTYQNHRRSDFGSVNIRPNTSTRPANRPISRPNHDARPDAPSRPGTTTRPGSSTSRPGSSSTRPGTSTSPGRENSGSTSRRESTTGKRENATGSSSSSRRENNSTGRENSSRRSSSESRRETTTPGSSTRSSSVSGGRSESRSSSSGSSSNTSRRSSSESSERSGSRR